MTNFLDLIGRIFISSVFLLSGYNKIFNHVNSHMFQENPFQNPNEFEKIVAGSCMGEEAASFPPNNVCIKNTVDFVDYSTTYAFYIKENRPISTEHECPICYNSIHNNDWAGWYFNCSHQFYVV